MPDLQCAGIVGQLVHYTTHQCCLALTVLAYERHFLAASDCECHMIEHHMLAKRFLNVIGYDGKVTATRCRRKLHPQAAVVFQIHFQTLEFVQLFDTALHLHALCRLVTEALDEFFRVLDHLLLILVGAHLLLMAFLTQRDKLRVRYVVVINPA